MTDPRATSTSPSGAYTPDTVGGTPAAPTPTTSRWEDFIDIFYAPSAVYRRRAEGNFWPPLLVVTILTAIIMLATASALQPALDAEFTRQSAAMMKANPQMTAEMMEKGRHIGELMQRWGSIVFMPIVILVVGVVTWLLGKLVDSKETLTQACMVAGFAYVPRVVGSIVMAVQGLLMDPARIKGFASLSAGPARFLDPDQASPVLMQVAMRLDAFIVWETVLLAIGVAVLGRTSRGKAIAAAIIFWLAGTLPAILQGMRVAATR